MSQAGKVLHLYVEVRSVPEEEGKRRAADGSAHLMLQCPDVLPHSPDLPPVIKHLTGVGSHSLPPPKSSSRHPASFQLQNPDAADSPPHFHRPDASRDSFGELLQVLVPAAGSPGPRGSLNWTPSSDMDPYQKRGLPAPSGRLTVPSTPTGTRRSYEVLGLGGEEGKTSVVKFGYIEKSNVHSGRRSSVSELGGPLLPPHLRKRLSDPVWCDGQQRQPEPYSRPPYPSQSQSPQGSPYLPRPALDAIARDATYRALEEFGSPELRRRFGGPENSSPTLPRHYHYPRCRSWAGSPVLPRGTFTLPSRVQLLDLDGGSCHGSLNGLPRSPASDELCAHTGRSAAAAAVAAAPHCQGSPRSRQRPWLRDESLRPSSKFHPPLPAGRPTDIQHEIPTSSQPGTGSRQRSVSSDRYNANHSAVTNTHCSTNSNSAVSSRTQSRPPSCSRASSRSTSPSHAEVACKLAVEAAGSRSTSPSHAEVACKLAVEAAKLSSIFAERRTPSPTPESLMGGSFLRESQPYATLQGRLSPEVLEADQWNQQNQREERNQWNPQNQWNQQNQRQRTDKPAAQTRPGQVSPLSAARLHKSVPSQAPVSDHQHQQSPSPNKDPSSLHRYQPPQFTGDRTTRVERRQYELLSDTSPNNSPEPCRRLQERRETGEDPGVYGPSREEHLRTDGGDVGGKTSVQSYHSDEVQDHSGAGGSSQSSSGVTGSMSPETSSQSSHDTADTGMQSDGSAATPTSRSQKIARAKWDFLFGEPPENRCNKDAPPSPSPTPPPSLHLKPANQRRERGLSHHQVRQIEVELVTSEPRGSAPKTGIIRRSVKYSETDLDAVPLRCYRETDLDEVMRAEAEAADEVEADCAFGSNRSVLLNSCFVTVDADLKKLLGKEEEEEEEEEEGVVSWASVRMQGDRQRQRATEEEEVFSLLLKRPSEVSSDGLKSPLSVGPPLGPPRRPSDSNLDSFSRHFESIMESHRAKGTSYSSLDSVDLLTSGSTSVFTFDLPTLTPEIQSQICESAKQILDLSFAPLARPPPPSETSRSEVTLSALGAGLKGGGRRSGLKDGFRKASSAPSLHNRERALSRPPELLQPQADVAERLALGDEALANALANGTKADLQAARRLAARLYGLEGFRKSDVARHLGKNNEFSQLVAEEYLSNFNFSSLTIDQALRKFLGQFALMGETQERERILAHFSRRYMQSNPESETTEDSVHTLTCAIMLLNSDLHGN
ncbi:uncharacterized protein psda isoform X1, partial [Scomber scombrus]